MATDTPQTDSAQPEYGLRTAKGEWRPPYPVKYAPLFLWPPRPIEALKWFLGYPGFLLPWNSIYLLISVVTWFWLQPALSRCVEFKVGWISQMYLRNLSLLWLATGGWHLLLYTFKVQGPACKYDPRWLRVGDRNFLFRNQLYDNIFWSCVSGCTVWTAYEVGYFGAAANHHVPYLSWTEPPGYFALWLGVIPLWREFPGLRGQVRIPEGFKVNSRGPRPRKTLRTISCSLRCQMRLCRLPQRRDVRYTGPRCRVCVIPKISSAPVGWKRRPPAGATV